MRTVIAGGGLVGLTAAASLQSIGHEVTVLEQAPQVRAAGAGIGLWPNALREFDQIGVGDEVRALGAWIDTWFFDPAGRPQRAPGYGTDDHRFLLVPRPALNRLLADRVGLDRIRLGARATGCTETDAEVVVHLEDGTDVRADLLIGADGVHSRIRASLVPGSEAVAHEGHFAWRALVPAGAERPEGSVLTIGGARTRGGYARVSPEQTMWMVNQFDVAELTGTKRERALTRARHLAAEGWHEDLLAMIEATPEEDILENQITLVPPLPRWTSDRIALIGDAAHGLSPHIAAGGTLGVEDVGVLRAHLADAPDAATAFTRYEDERRARFDQVREHSAAVEKADGAAEFAERYAAFSHWMLTTS
ncbi:putative monooxygenase [Actinacidiphila reveromycinica]|uniref:Putative monooxygenase n=1 Tax=Actinacidiphila reveromycinica TaxID=659352 RepID=A0A7U3URV0_9ACTN|nr:FAD-dependent monooxygenase [Streptomyces sp. SN-593]BBA97570.1 putative monooxygenase [Streptomyces sp. SN-593]